MKKLTRTAALTFLLFAACGRVGGDTPMTGDDAGPVDTPDASPVDTPDADVAPEPSPPGVEVTSVAGHVDGPTYQLDFQLGHTTGREPATGNTYSMEGEAAIKP